MCDAHCPILAALSRAVAGRAESVHGRRYVLDVLKFEARLPVAQAAVSTRLHMDHNDPGFHTVVFVMGTRDASGPGV
jgi:hypothetical protein